MELRLEKHIEACGALAACGASGALAACGALGACEAPSRKIIGKIIGR